MLSSEEGLHVLNGLDVLNPSRAFLARIYIRKDKESL